MYRALAGARLEPRPADAKNISDVQVLEAVIGGLAHVVTPHIHLDSVRPVAQVREGRLAHDAGLDQAAGHDDLLAVQRVEARLDLRSEVRPLVTLDDERVLTGDAQSFQLGEALAPDVRFL